MSRIVLMAFLTFAGAIQASANDEWVNNPPKNLQSTNAMQIVEASQIAEVPISLADQAFDLLANTPVLEISENYFSGFRLPCPKQSKPYLVRAVYEHGGNGVFHVKQYGQTLWVFHYALGAAAPRHRSALVVCLSTEPTTIYVSAGGAR